VAPDRKGCLLVFVGGKYGQWTSVQNDDDSITLIPVTSTGRSANPNQLSFADDGEIDLKDLGRGPA
jgi:hypothetical protein